MTDEQILKHYDRMVEIFGDELPDPEVYPKTFAHFVKLYKHYYVEPEPTMSEG